METQWACSLLAAKKSQSVKESRDETLPGLILLSPVSPVSPFTFCRVIFFPPTVQSTQPCALRFVTLLLLLTTAGYRYKAKIITSKYY